MKSLPIGVEDFKEFRENDYFYVDKTNMINDVIQEKVVLYTRPRRFGKTLNMSMLNYFFSIKENSKELFQGLNISNNAEAMKRMNQYPVVFVSLKECKALNFDGQLDAYKNEIISVYRKYNELSTSEFLSEGHKKDLKKYILGDLSVGDLKYSLRFLSECLSIHYQQRVVVLIDEYDVPLQSAYSHGYYDQTVDFLRGLLSSVLKTNEYLEKGVLTGCLRIAKESIFTGLNNLNVYSILDKAASTCFGFTQQDISELLESYGLKNQMERVKEWYDGYLFGDTEIYNPWSTLKYIQKVIQGQDEPTSFWANTSGNDIVYRYINESNLEMKTDFDALIHGSSIEKEIKPELTYREMDDINNIYSFLLFTGYLKIKENLGNNFYTIEIPNKEIRYIYEKIFSEWFNFKREEQSEPFINALVNGDETTARKILNKLLQQTVSYYDSNESFYHGLLLGLINSRKFDFTIKSNRESGEGRYDIALIPSDFDDTGIIIECKYSDAKENLIEDSKKAIRQISEKKYIEGMKIEGYTNFYGYGISFYKKNCFISKL